MQNLLDWTAIRRLFVYSKTKVIHESGNIPLRVFTVEVVPATHGARLYNVLAIDAL